MNNPNEDFEDGDPELKDGYLEYEAQIECRSELEGQRLEEQRLEGLRQAQQEMGKKVYLQ